MEVIHWIWIRNYGKYSADAKFQISFPFFLNYERWLSLLAKTFPFSSHASERYLIKLISSMNEKKSFTLKIVVIKSIHFFFWCVSCYEKEESTKHVEDSIMLSQSAWEEDCCRYEKSRKIEEETFPDFPHFSSLFSTVISSIFGSKRRKTKNSRQHKKARGSSD